MSEEVPAEPDPGRLRDLIPPRPALVLGASLLASLILCAVIPIYFSGLAALLGFVMGVMGGIASALSTTSRTTKVVTGLLYGVAGAVGLLVADNPLLAAGAVFAAGLIQAPLNARAMSLGIFLPVLVAVFATVDVNEEPAVMALWVLAGFGAIHWLARLFNLPTTQTAIGLAAAWRHAVVFAVAAGAIHYLLMEWGTPHGYWLVLTLASVLRPVSGETRAAAVDRTVGTVAGVFLAMLLVWTFPLAICLLFALACVALMIGWAVMQDLRKQTMFGTPGVVLFGSAGALNLSVEVAAERLLLTLLGVVIAVGAVVVMDVLERRGETHP